MCYTKCNAGRLRASSIVLKTQYFMLKTMTILVCIICEIFYTELVYLLYKQIHMLCDITCVLKVQRQGDVML